MNKRLKLSSDHIQTATGSGPKPGDYPPGSLESRAAARALLENRAGELAAEELELTPFQQERRRANRFQKCVKCLSISPD